MKICKTLLTLLIFGLLLFNVSDVLAIQDTSKRNSDEAHFAAYQKDHPKGTRNLSEDQTVQDPVNADEQSPRQKIEWIQDKLCIALLTFALILSSLEVLLFLKGKIDSTQVVKLLVITLIIFSLLFLISAGFDNTQTQTSVGLLGTIAGYLLGKSASDDAHRQKTNSTDATS